MESHKFSALRESRSESSIRLLSFRELYFFPVTHEAAVSAIKSTGNSVFREIIAGLFFRLYLKCELNNKWLTLLLIVE
jgi:hypothetical protein